MRSEALGRNVRIALLAGVASLSLALSAPSALAQDPAYETHFSANEMAEAPCPPSFPALYRDDVFGVFWGRSAFTMVQWDEYHTYQMYTYQFTGATLDGKTKVTGIHHVNARQCTAAAYAYWVGIPAVIAVLHLAQFKSLACGEGGTGSTQLAEIVHEPGYDPYDSHDRNAGGGSDCGDGEGETGGVYEGGTGEGSGIQYRPGDSTGGETVEWSTGTGNGGTSACGDQAIVEQVCIDFYNEDTGTWEEWSCGYATTC